MNKFLQDNINMKMDNLRNTARNYADHADKIGAAHCLIAYSLVLKHPDLREASVIMTSYPGMD